MTTKPTGILKPPPPRCLICGELRSVCTGHAQPQAVTFDGRHYSDCTTYAASCWCAARREHELKQKEQPSND